MAVKSFVLVEATKILADGQWHDLEETTRKLYRFVPPSVASHFNERIRSNAWKRAHPGEEVQPRQGDISAEQQVAIGLRQYVTRVLYDADRIEHGIIKETGQRLIRLRTKLVEPPTPHIMGVTSFLIRPAMGWPFCQLPIEEQREKDAARIAKMRATLLRKNGHDPETYKSRHQLKREKGGKEEWADTESR